MRQHDDDCLCTDCQLERMDAHLEWLADRDRDEARERTT